MTLRVFGLLLCLALLGCGGSGRLPAGIVTSKDFVPAHTDMVMVPIITSDGKNTHTTMVPMFFHEPDRWHLTVEPYSAEGNPLPVKRLTVTKQAYDAVKLGEWFQQAPETMDTRQASKTRAD